MIVKDSAHENLYSFLLSCLQAQRQCQPSPHCLVVPGSTQVTGHDIALGSSASIPRVPQTMFPGTGPPGTHYPLLPTVASHMIPQVVTQQPSDKGWSIILSMIIGHHLPTLPTTSYSADIVSFTFCYMAVNGIVTLHFKGQLLRPFFRFYICFRKVYMFH